MVIFTVRYFDQFAVFLQGINGVEQFLVGLDGFLQTIFASVFQMRCIEVLECLFRRDGGCGIPTKIASGGYFGDGVFGKIGIDFDGCNNEGGNGCTHEQVG